MNIEQWQKWLKSYSACSDGYAEACNKLPDEWYQSTGRSDWMIWVLRKLPKHKEDKKLWVAIAIESAKLVLHLTKDEQQRPQIAIEAAVKWLENPTEENRIAAYAATNAAAYSAADAAAYSAAAAANATHIMLLVDGCCRTPVWVNAALAHLRAIT
jgi:hypothetical protein